MKKIFVLSVFLLSMCTFSFAQKINISKVPNAVRTEFEKKFPGLVASWEKEGEQYEAGFKKQGNSMSAVFDASGQMTESEMEMKLADLPAKAVSFVKANYGKSAILGAAKITKSAGETNYEIELKRKDLIFDEQGNFIKEMKE